MAIKMTKNEFAALSELMAQGEYWVDYKETEYSDGDSYEYELADGVHVGAGEFLKLAWRAFEKLAGGVEVGDE